MTDEPFGRQPEPVTVTVTGRDSRDVYFWVSHLVRAAEYKGDMTVRVGEATFTIHPRAVND